MSTWSRCFGQRYGSAEFSLAGSAAEKHFYFAYDIEHRAFQALQPRRPLHVARYVSGDLLSDDRSCLNPGECGKPLYQAISNKVVRFAWRIEDTDRWSYCR